MLTEHAMEMINQQTKETIKPLAQDAAKLGFRVIVRTDLCRAIDLGGTLAVAEREMQSLGVMLTSEG